MDEITKTQSLINSIIGEGTRFRGDLDLQGCCALTAISKETFELKVAFLSGRADGPGV
jgi:hypothetical protein